MTPEVSLIIPIYNTEKELSRCLDSIQHQTYSNWECLLIDDGSTDSSGLICDEYKKLDSRFRVYHKKNEGGGAARNFGMKYAEGEFVAFIDSDDWIENIYLEFLLANINDDTDMVMCHAVFEYPNSSVEALKVQPDIIICTGDNKTNYILSSINRGYAKNILHEEIGFLNTVWGKIYRKKVIEKASLEFLNIGLNEDAIFNLYFFEKTRGFRIYNKILYHYCIRDSSAVHSFKENYIEIYNEYLNEIKKFIKLYYRFEDRFKESYNSLVITSLFNITKDYFYNPDFTDIKNGKSRMLSLIETSPYKEALKEFDKSIAKRIEVIIVAYVYKLKLFWLLNIYFSFRQKLKSFIIVMGRSRK